MKKPIKILLIALIFLFLITLIPLSKLNSPVCGKINVQCITTPCDPVQETFKNIYQSKKANAFDIQKGTCITNFEECIKAGNPAMESYPRQCRANGKTFVEEI
jgi:hypothetical protein